jgi:hypothetical protein
LRAVMLKEQRQCHPEFLCISPSSHKRRRQPDFQRHHNTSRQMTIKTPAVAQTRPIAPSSQGGGHHPCVVRQHRLRPMPT